jgi:hypothetical protein
VPDKTLKEIKRFKNKHPEINVRVLEAVLPKKEAKIGNIRKILNDAVLLRGVARGRKSQDLIMVSNDADNCGLAPEYVENFIRKFEENKNVDAMLGQLDWDPGAYVRNPLVHIGTRLFQYVEVQARRKGYHIGSSGANFAFRSSMYAAIGGYSPNRTGGEDTNLGTRMVEARRNSSQHVPIAFAGARVSRLYTSARRAEKALKDGLSPIEQWDKGFSAFDDEVRKVRWDKSGKNIDYDDPGQIKELVENIEKIINRTILRSKNWLNSRDPILGRSLEWLGVKFDSIDDYTIKITDASSLVQGLKQYQKDGLKILSRKTHKK